MPRLSLPAKGHSRPVSFGKENPGYFLPAGFKEGSFEHEKCELRMKSICCNAMNVINQT